MEAGGCNDLHIWYQIAFSRVVKRIRVELKYRSGFVGEVTMLCLDPSF